MEPEKSKKGNESNIIVAMKGHPGTGKSTLAHSIATALKCPLLDKDDFRDCTSTLQYTFQSHRLDDPPQSIARHQTSAPSTHTSNSSGRRKPSEPPAVKESIPSQHLLSFPPSTATCNKLLNDFSYEVLWRVASTQLSLGLSVVIDSPLSRKSHLDRLLQLAASCVGCRLVIVECKPKGEAEWRRRLEQRGAAVCASWHKPATWRDLEKLLEDYGGCSEYDVGKVPKLVVDTTGDVGVEELVSSVLEFMDSCCGCC